MAVRTEVAVKPTLFTAGASNSRWELRRAVFWLALPAVGEQVLNTMVGLTDQYLVGHLEPGVAAAQGYDRATAIAAVGVANMIGWIVTTLFLAIAVGATTIVARRIGEGERERADETLQQALIFAFCIGLVSMVVAPLAEPLLRLLGAAPEVVQAGTQYLQIITLASIPTAMLFAGTAALRGAGDTKSALNTMLIVNVVNMAVAWLLVNGNFGLPGMGVQGAALGAAIGRTTGAVVLIGLLLAGKMRLKLTLNLRPNLSVIRRLAQIGLPSAGEQFIFQGAVIIMTGLISQLGTAAYAAHSLTISIESVSFLPGFGFATAAAAMVGQALGARNPELAERATWEAFWQGGIVMTVLGLIMAIWPAPLIGFMTPDAAVIEQAINPLRLAGLGQVFLAVSFILVGALRGAGDTTWPLWMRVITTWVVRVPLILLFYYGLGWGLFGIWVAMFTDFAVQALLAWHRFAAGKWKAITV